MATYAKKAAHNGGMTGNAKKVTKAAKGGKIASQAAPPLPKQKLALGFRHRRPQQQRVMAAKTGLASGAAVAPSMPSATKKKKQANGSNPAGYTRRKPPTNTRSKGAAKTRGGTKSSKGSGDSVPGKTNYSYAGKK